MNENQNYYNWLEKEFDIVVDSDEKKEYFNGVINVNECNDDYCSSILAFKGDPLISFMVCDRKMDGIKLTPDRKLTYFNSEKEKFIGDNLFIEIFNKIKMSDFTNHNKSNQIGKEVKSACIEAFIYAIYKTYDMKKKHEQFFVK
ncbi:MAG: hypothetical protein ACRCRZ_01275 [Metamycoplasmataceae bacterium]